MEWHRMAILVWEGDVPRLMGLERTEMKDEAI